MSSESELFLLEYIDHRPIQIKAGLSKYSGGLTLPAKDPKNNILRVTAKEKENLLAWRNGADPCFREISG